MPTAAALTITSAALSFLTRPISTAEQTARTTKLLAHTELMKRLILMNSGWSHSVSGVLRLAIASVNGCPTTSEVTAMAPSAPADRAVSQRCTEECGETSAIALMAPPKAIQGRKPRTYSTMRRRLWETSQRDGPRGGTPALSGRYTSAAPSGRGASQRQAGLTLTVVPVNGVVEIKAI